MLASVGILFFLKHVLFYFMFSHPSYPPSITGKKKKKKGKKPHNACFHGSFVFFQTPAFIFYVSSSIILTK